MPFVFDNTYARLPGHFYARVEPTPVRAPALIRLNRPLARLLGVAEAELTPEACASIFSGNQLPAGAEPIALAYAGHQFGAFVPQLGDGRAILLGEVVGRDGRRRDVQLKGAGRTPYSRGGDGRAAMGPVLREYLLSEAMFALGVPTTRALAAVTTGEPVYRETALPGAVVTRVAASHLRVGTFQFFAARKDRAALETLTAYALNRHYPEVPRAGGDALALFEAVLEAQARLVASWLALGFVHGVMNTDNTSIAGETIDYGPCAFLDAFEPARTFSSIDHGGRYAFANQPRIAAWNVARLADALIPLVSEDSERAIAVLSERLESFAPRFEAAYVAALARKLGIAAPRDGDLELAEALLALMARERRDYTLSFRHLTEFVSGSDHVTPIFSDVAGFETWAARWRERLRDEPGTVAECAERMRRANPAFIPRNHQVERMISAAVAGDYAPFERLLAVLERPYDDQPDHADLAAPPGDEQWEYRTFCGT
jgi:uncharacterized protein YdiU (UPF0061 family)